MMQQSPQKIGRYEILSELGRGAMGLVYKASDPNIGRTVALKTMRLDVHGVAEEEILRRFKHEAKLAGVMNHPNIVTIYDAGEFEGVFYIAMEFIDGVTLQSVLHEHRTLPVERATDVARQVCAGLDYAHAHGVIHRDVKPANIMLGDSGVIKIMDFGIAKSGAGMTSVGQVLGTPTYMSPEQVRGKALDGRSDLFSFGVVLYETVTGEKPFTGQNITTIIYKIMNEAPIPPRELDVTIHPGLSALITKALAKNPDERYQTGADLVRDLENYKGFGSSAEATKVIAAANSSVATTKIPAPYSPDEPTSGITLPHLQAVAEVPAPAKPVASAHLESTVKVAPRAAASVPPVAAKRPVGMLYGGGAALALVLLLGAYFGLKPSQPEAQTAQSQAPASTTANPPAQAQTPPQVALPEASKSTAGTASEEKPIDSAAPPQTAAAENVPPAIPAVKKAAQPKGAAPKNFSAETRTVPLPAAAASPTTVQAQISSSPAGAKVSIGGATEPDWVTPFAVKSLAPGKYELTFSKPGFVTQKKNIEVVAGSVVNVGAQLTEAGARITVSSTPAGAAILLDGKATGKFTPAQMLVERGEHRIMLLKEGFREANTTANIGDGENYQFAPVLESKAQAAAPNPLRAIRGLFGGRIPEGKGMLNLQSRPAGAQVIHEGKPAAKATPLRWPMAPGTYKVTLRMPGYKPQQREFTIEKGKTTDIMVDLVPAP